MNSYTFYDDPMFGKNNLILELARPIDLSENSYEQKFLSEVQCDEMLKRLLEDHIFCEKYNGLSSSAVLANMFEDKFVLGSILGKINVSDINARLHDDEREKSCIRQETLSLPSKFDGCVVLSKKLSFNVRSFPSEINYSSVFEDMFKDSSVTYASAQPNYKILKSRWVKCLASYLDGEKTLTTKGLVRYRLNVKLLNKNQEIEDLQIRFAFKFFRFYSKKYFSCPNLRQTYKPLRLSQF